MTWTAAQRELGRIKSTIATAPRGHAKLLALQAAAERAIELVAEGFFEKGKIVDELQVLAEANGIVADVGMDVVQNILERAMQKCEPLVGRDKQQHKTTPSELKCDGEFDVHKLNREFALVLIGNKAVIISERPKAPIEDQRRILTIEAFSAFYKNHFTEIEGPDGKCKKTTWAKAWLESPERRSYLGVEFHPDPCDVPGTPGYFNLWSGFTVRPALVGDWTKYKTLRDHLLINICGGDERYFAWVFGFFAHMVQRPRERIGVALVLRGPMGSGKTIVGEIFGRLIQRHYFLVDNARYVTGNFNSHMAECLLLQADEAVWAGDKQAEGRLKGLVTSSFQQIERKGIDPIRLPNYVRLLMTANEDWVVPAGKEERRFAVFDVGPSRVKDYAYFAQIIDEIDHGGLEYLLADLLAFDLSIINLREIPQTKALLEQKLLSLSAVEGWWLDRLWAGSPLRNGSGWAQLVPSRAIFDDYIGTSEKAGIRRRSLETSFGRKFHKLVPGLEDCRPLLKGDDGVLRRTHCYQLPSLVKARENFERQLGQRIDWPSMHEDNTSTDDTVPL
jgi:hypothetical protein